MVSTNMAPGDIKPQNKTRVRLTVAGGLLIVLFGACLWSWRQQYEFKDAYVASIHEVQGIDDRFPEVVTGPDLFARWKGDGFMEWKVIWGRCDEDRLQKFAEEYRWERLGDSDTFGNSKLDLIPESVRGSTTFEQTDPYFAGMVPLRNTWAAIRIVYSRKTGIALVEIKR